MRRFSHTSRRRILSARRTCLLACPVSHTGRELMRRFVRLVAPLKAATARHTYIRHRRSNCRSHCKYIKPSAVSVYDTRNVYATPCGPTCLLTRATSLMHCNRALKSNRFTRSVSSASACERGAAHRASTYVPRVYVTAASHPIPQAGTFHHRETRSAC
jgi:hypothetical protein